MADSPAPAWTDHDVSDPGVTLLQVVAYTIGGVAVAAAVVARFRRTRRTGVTAGAEAALPIRSILDRLKTLVRPLLRRVLG